MKKILWLFLVIFVLSYIVPEGNNVYAKSGTSLVASSATTEKDKAAINIHLKDNSGIWALKFKVFYDHTKLKLNSTQNGKVFASGDITLPESLDKDDFVFLASSNSLKDIEKNGTVITLHFKAKSYATEGKYPINKRYMKIWSALKERGVGLALDDFGTGYSNFNYMSQLEPDLIKIDRNFTAKALNNEYDYNMLTLIHKMVFNLGLKICIEGVETKGEMEKIKSMCPNFFQGYFFGRPCPYEDFVSQFVKNKK